MAPARLVSGSFTHSDEFVRVTASPGQGGGTCFGDSGGPILNGNTDTVLAVNSYVTGILRAQAPPFRAGLARPARSALLADVRLEGPQRCPTSRGRELRPGPQVLPVGTHPVALAQPASRDALEGVHQPGDRDLRGVDHEQVDGVVLAVQLDQLGAQVRDTRWRTPRQGRPGARRSAAHADIWSPRPTAP
jgi:hypothetical protein